MSVLLFFIALLGSGCSDSSDSTSILNEAITGIDDNERSGSAYVFSKTDTGWEQQAFLKADDADTEDQFGASIAIDATGSTLVVGAPYFNFADPTLTGPIGAAYIFKKKDRAWQQETRLNASWQGDVFGRDVALSGDGNTLMVASEGASNSGVGLVYVYVWDNETWFEQTKLIGSNAEREDRFGHTLSLSNDGETLIVGAPGEKSAAQGINGNQNDNSGENTGAVYLF